MCNNGDLHVWYRNILKESSYKSLVKQTKQKFPPSSWPLKIQMLSGFLLYISFGRFAFVSICCGNYWYIGLYLWSTKVIWALIDVVVHIVFSLGLNIKSQKFLVVTSFTILAYNLSENRTFTQELWDLDHPKQYRK